jgi:hypothetical protein
MRCNKLFRKHKNAIIHVVSEHGVDKMFAEFNIMPTPYIPFIGEKPVDA